MYMHPARHPRAGMAIGLAILAAWLGAIGVAAATGDSPTGVQSAAPASGAVDAASVRPAHAGPGYIVVSGEK
jgi:hypothetical protein